MHATKTETKFIRAVSAHCWRFVCITCGEEGEWVLTPRLAERQAVLHNVQLAPELPGVKVTDGPDR
jgi:hypothetical protein